MICVSINYKKADADIRGKFAFDEKMTEKLYDAFREAGASECVVLCTCSRTEVYAEDITAEKILSLLSDASAVRDIRQYAMIFIGKNAVYHLFNVSCGMDSMVLGEDEILGQTRDAYKRASEMGMTGHRLNMIFQSALACAKKVKTDTSLSGVPVSTATLAAHEAVNAGNNILIIGASGKIGNSTLKNILSNKNTLVTVTARKHTPDISPRYRDRVRIVPYDDRYEYINSSDCIISATAGPVYTLTFEKVKEKITDSRQRLFIDLAVPKDIDERINEIGHARILDIDHFEKLSENNSTIKLSAKEKAEAIILAETETLRKNMAVHILLSSSGDVKKKLSENGIEPLIYKLKNELDADGFERFVSIISVFGKE